MLIDSDVLVWVTRGNDLALSHGLRLADALIAATAIEQQARLLTANIKHFSAIDGLQIEVFEP